MYYAAEFVTSFRHIADTMHEISKDHGWWDDGGQNVGEKIALMHSELSEALEAARKGNPPDSHCPEFSSEEIELADCIIRIMDYASSRGYDIGSALIAKAKFNKTRPHKHGGKVF